MALKQDFFADVYDVVRLIPRGRVTSYGAIARYLGTARSARVVGWAMNNCHNIADIPAHRVLNRNGLLSGKMHFPPQRPMERLLEDEGHRIEGDQLADFDKYFWDPAVELGV